MLLYLGLLLVLLAIVGAFYGLVKQSVQYTAGGLLFAIVGLLVVFFSGGK
jgi:hypothetical protein